MLRYLMKAGEPRLEMQDQSPSIYLDHWAIRRLSEDPSQSSRFVQILKESSGTLYVSSMNILEFAKVSDKGSAHAAEELLEGCMPNLYFIESNPWIVVGREDQLLMGASRAVAPHRDFELLRLVASLRPKGLEPITIRSIFSEISNTEELRRRIDDLGKTFRAQVEQLRLESREDGEFRRGLLRVPDGPGVQRATRYLINQVLRFCIMDERLKLAPNDAMDFLHSVVPVSYADVVLLDRRWATQAQGAVERLRAEGHEAEAAEVLWGTNAINQLLETLEKKHNAQPLRLNRTDTALSHGPAG